MLGRLNHWAGSAAEFAHNQLLSCQIHCETFMGTYTLLQTLEDQMPHLIGCWCSLHVDQNAVSQTRQLRTDSGQMVALPCFLVITEAALATDLIRSLKLKHLERNSVSRNYDMA